MDTFEYLLKVSKKEVFSYITKAETFLAGPEENWTAIPLAVFKDMFSGLYSV